MPSSFFGNVMVTPVSTLSSYSTSSIGGTATTTVTVQKGSGTYTYTWTAPGCTITNGTTVTPTFTYTAAGTTNAYCTIRNNNTGISVTSPTFVITWTSPATTFTFTPSGNTTYVYDGTAKTITYTTSPAGATASVTSGSLSITNVGSTSATVTANSPYTGSALSPTITITPLPISTPATWRLNGVLFSSAQTVSYTGSNYAIACTAVTPSGASGSYTPTSQNYSAIGSYSLTSSGTGNYSGSVTSPVLTIAGALAVGSMVNGAGGYNNTGDATTSGTVSGGTPPYTISWAKVGSLAPAISLQGYSGSPTSTATWRNSTLSTNSSTVRMSVTDSVGGTASNTATITWNIA